MFSATIGADVLETIQKYVSPLECHPVANEALKLKGVKMFRMDVNQILKKDTILDVYETFDSCQTMIFVNKKTEADDLKAFLDKQGYQASCLHSGVKSQAERD